MLFKRKLPFIYTRKWQREDAIIARSTRNFIRKRYKFRKFAFYLKRLKKRHRLGVV